MFEQIPPGFLLVATSVIALFMGSLLVFVRSKAAKYPVTAKKIILPPLFMSTGALMFTVPFFRVGFTQIVEAFAVGMLFSVVLIVTTKFEVRGDAVYMKQSKAFLFILIGLLLFRLILKAIIGTSVDVGELSGMFWILAFGMIVPWRIAMFIQFKKLQNETKSAVPD
ncbi:CcdC family protein [Indiicoccus explosivorum]|uniref:CcdC family protein n=1 Tax=Indiicoccus explosivorum TaxID=1917864 RepID=UPI000B42F788|nr:cytochrome c biogenesis protein CcdC [Indiicoccus explosivorum]